MTTAMPHSIEERLRRLVAIVVMATLLPLSVLGAYRSLAKANELSDIRLRQTAATVDALLHQTGVGPVLENLALAPSVAAHKGDGHTYEEEVGYRVSDLRGHTVLVTDNVKGLPLSLPIDGRVHSAVFRRRTWHVYTQRDDDLGVVVSVVERHDTRRDITNGIAVERILPLLIGVPLLYAALHWAVRRGLRPLGVLERMLRHRRAGSRETVVLHDPPREMQPIVHALNAQISRIEGALERERCFSADVAHELRTPLAATMIGLDDALAARSESYQAVALPEALESLRLLARRTDQLLVLARLDDDTSASFSVIDMVFVASDVLVEWMPTVDLRRFHLSTELPAHPLPIRGHAAALAAMLRNLLENAARHVREGGHVTLRMACETGGVVVEVIDDGPGIPPERRDAVFARFHREKGELGDGFGVGLSIVQRVAKLHDALVSLEDSPWASGLRVRVRFPLVAGSIAAQ